MQRAAAGLAAAVLDLLGSAYGRRVLLLVGSGDNGGDALYAGAMLARRGVAVEAWLLSDQAHEARPRRAAAGRRPRRRPSRRDAPEVVVDGIVGIGGRAGLRPEARARSSCLHGVPVVAVDTPSGVDVDTGEVDGRPRRARAHGHLRDPQGLPTSSTRRRRPAARCTWSTSGSTCPAPAVEALQPEDVAALLPRPALESQKYARGVVGVRAGSTEYPGAALLSVSGAACGLAGMVRYVGEAAVAHTVREQHPEVVGRAGCRRGWSARAAARTPARSWPRRSRTACRSSPTPTRSSTCEPGQAAVLTPHAGELAAMLGEDRAEVEARPLHFARAAAEQYDAVVLLKGRRTARRPPGRPGPRQHHRHAWLATAGAGDVLGGVVGALLAAGLDAVRRGERRARGCTAPRPRWPRRRPDRRERGGARAARVGATGDRGECWREAPSWSSTSPRSVTTCGPSASTPGSRMMTVVKADAYGHGLVEAARAARDGGADWLGVATIDEALALRAAGDTGRVLCWLTVPGDDWAAAIAADVDVTAYSVADLDAIAATGRKAARPAQGRHRAEPRRRPLQRWPEVVARAERGVNLGEWTLTGIWSHLSSSDEPDDPANAAQEEAFRRRPRVAEDAGLRPELRHLANSAAAILRPSSRFDLVRCGIASYGLDPAPGVTPDLGLRPAMTARAGLALVKPVAAGAAVSYGRTWVADRDTTLGLVPAGYADGLLRAGSNRAEVQVGGKRRTVRGRICMDQFVVDLEGDDPGEGAEVTLFGTGARGEPTAQDWAEACGTISYEVVSRIGGRFTRRYVDSERLEP